MNNFFKQSLLSVAFICTLSTSSFGMKHNNQPKTDNKTSGSIKKSTTQTPKFDQTIEQQVGQKQDLHTHDDIQKKVNKTEHASSSKSSTPSSECLSSDEGKLSSFEEGKIKQTNYTFSSQNPLQQKEIQQQQQFLQPTWDIESIDLSTIERGNFAIQSQYIKNFYNLTTCVRYLEDLLNLIIKIYDYTDNYADNMIDIINAKLGDTFEQEFSIDSSGNIIKNNEMYMPNYMQKSINEIVTLCKKKNFAKCPTLIAKYTVVYGKTHSVDIGCVSLWQEFEEFMKYIITTDTNMIEQHGKNKKTISNLIALINGQFYHIFIDSNISSCNVNFPLPVLINPSVMHIHFMASVTEHHSLARFNYISHFEIENIDIVNDELDIIKDSLAKRNDIGMTYCSQTQGKTQGHCTLNVCHLYCNPNNPKNLTNAICERFHKTESSPKNENYINKKEKLFPKECQKLSIFVEYKNENEISITKDVNIHAHNGCTITEISAMDELINKKDDIK